MLKICSLGAGFRRQFRGSLGRCPHIKVLAALTVLFLNPAFKAWGHAAPEEDSSQSSYSKPRWDGWNNDWDRRWRRNWGNVWAPRDNDPYVRRTYTTNNYYQQGQNKPCEWGCVQNPGKDIPNFHEVHPYLYRGGQPTEGALDMLNSMGVSTVVDLRCDPQQTESERQLCEHHGLRFINIPLVKTACPSDQDVSRFMDVVGSARENPDRGAVFVHDHLGADRTGCMVAIYRELADKYPYDRACGEMKQYGFHDNYVQLKQAVQKFSQNQPQKVVPAAKPKAKVQHK